MFNEQWMMWGGFTLFIIIMLIIDLGVFQRKPHVVSRKEALLWFSVWMGLAMLFNIGIALFHERGTQAAIEFFTGFLVEKSLSIDNVFVFILIFNYFRVPPVYQHKVLFWGILGAIIMRVAFIIGGLTLMHRFHWIIYVFGTFLVFTGIGMMRKNDSDYDPEKNWILRAFQRHFSVTTTFVDSRFFLRSDGRLWATPLFIVLLAIESSDIIFAVDSIPAIFAITSDPFIVYTSNIFAMLGLRALYFAVGGFMQMFHFLHYGFASIILILGLKMLLSDVYHVPVFVSLVLIVFILLICIILSLLRPRSDDLKPLFRRTERMGLIPFRRLLFIENIIDLDELRVRYAMRNLDGVKIIHLDRPWEENLRMIRETKYSRYPVVEREGGSPKGIIHIKSLLTVSSLEQLTVEQLQPLVRPCLDFQEDVPLEEALARFQGRSEQMAVVFNKKQKWTGIITLEDVMEELVGRIGDEFELEREGPVISLADALSPGRIIFDLRADSMDEAIRQIISRIPRKEWPVDPKLIAEAVLKREQAMPTYLRSGLSIPHARLDGLSKPVLAFGRSPDGVPLEKDLERAELFFLLLTPGSMARLQPRILAEIVGLFESEYVIESLRRATTPEEIINEIRTAQQVVLD
jgi:tellurite resistance protein TerC